MNTASRNAVEAPRNLALRRALADRIGELVAAGGSTQVEAAVRLGLTQPRLNALLRGRIEQFRLASSGFQRAAAAPDVPTFKELGVAAFESMGWQGFHAPARTPGPTVERLSAAIAAAIKAPEVGERLLPLGLTLVGSTPDEFARHEARETAKWAPVVKATGFRADQ